MTTKSEAYLRASSIVLGGGLDTPGYEYVLLEDALEAVKEARGELDMERLARAVVEPYEDTPEYGRCRICGDDGATVGAIEEPDDLAREYAREET